MLQVVESLEMDVLDYKYDLSLVNEAIKAVQLGQQGEDVVRHFISICLNPSINMRMHVPLACVAPRPQYHKLRYSAAYLQVVGSANGFNYKTFPQDRRNNFLAFGRVHTDISSIFVRVLICKQKHNDDISRWYQLLYF